MYIIVHEILLARNQANSPSFFSDACQVSYIDKAELENQRGTHSV